MSAKLTHFAHPRGWIKGEPVVPVGERKVQLERDRFQLTPAGQAQVEEITHLNFASAEFRDQWLKWWRKA